MMRPARVTLEPARFNRRYPLLGLSSHAAVLSRSAILRHPVSCNAAAAVCAAVALDAAADADVAALLALDAAADADVAALVALVAAAVALDAAADAFCVAVAAAASARSRDSVDTTTTIPGSGVAGMTVVKSTTPPDGTSKVTGFG